MRKDTIYQALCNLFTARFLNNRQIEEIKRADFVKEARKAYPKIYYSTLYTQVDKVLASFIETQQITRIARGKYKKI